VTGPSVNVSISGISVYGTFFRVAPSDVAYTMAGGAGVLVNWDGGGLTVPGGSVTLVDTMFVGNTVKLLNPSTSAWALF
jgi:hypothetical protein